MYALSFYWPLHDTSIYSAGTSIRDRVEPNDVHRIVFSSQCKIIKLTAAIKTPVRH